MYKIINRIIEHFSMSKVWQRRTCHTVQCNILHKTNNFPIAKTKAILLLVKPISEEKSLYKNAFDRRNTICIDKKMLNKSKII